MKYLEEYSIPKELKESNNPLKLQSFTPAALIFCWVMKEIKKMEKQENELLKELSREEKLLMTLHGNF